jgi:CHASE1-domain containing sensor protein
VLSRKIAYEFPGVRGFGFIQQVERSALNTFVAQEKADGAPDFAIHDLG